jgi:hypothetical protein
MEALFKRDPGKGATQEIGQTEALEDLERRVPWPWTHEVGGATNKLYTIAQKAFIDDSFIIDYINEGVEVKCIV